MHILFKSVIFSISFPTSTQVHRVHGIYIYQFNSPLYFTSAGVFCSLLYIETGINPTDTTDTMSQGSLQQCASKAIVNTHTILYIAMCISTFLLKLINPALIILSIQLEQILKNCTSVLKNSKKNA